MPSEKEEVERLKRLRQQQIAARDPTAKDKAFYGMVSARRKKDKVTLGGVLKDFEAKWTWMAAGGIVGTILAIILAATVRTTWSVPIAVVIIFAGLVVGRLLGSVIDWRDDDWQRK